MKAAVLALCVLTWVPLTGSATSLTDAVALVDAGRYQEAKDLIATISPTAPDYSAGQCYNALCLYGLNERFAFWQATESLELKQANVPAAVREDLSFKQIEVLFYFRKFEEIFPKLQAFQVEYATAARANVVAEYRLASLFERGMKKAQESAKLKDEEQFTRRWSEGKANLEEFLSLAGAAHWTNYPSLAKRDLRKDIWVARLTSGDEKAVLEEIPLEDTAAREQAKLLRVQLYLKLQPDQIERNLGFMSDFLREFPASASRKRLEFDIASLSYRRGEALWKEADALDRDGNSAAAEEKRTTARQFLQKMRSLQGEVVEDKAAGIAASDVIDLRGDLLSSYCLEKDYSRVYSLAASMVAESSTGDQTWIVGKLYEGIAMYSQSLPQSAGAAKILDEVLALKQENKPNRDYYVLLAARWRVRIALDGHDKDKARQIVQSVQNGSYTPNMKKTFLTDHAGLVRPQTLNSN